VANRRYTSQFSYSFERQAVRLMGSFKQTDLGAFAARTISGITYTAVTMGAAGNSITITVTSGGTAGAEVVTVSGTAISIQIQSGTSTQTQVKAALDASAAASALVGTSVASGSTAVTATSVLPLQNGDDTDFDASSTCMTLVQTGTGRFQIQLPDSYPNLIGASIMLSRPSAAVDLSAQLASIDVVDAQTINFRMIAGASPTNMANDDELFISLELRNSVNSTVSGA
jgi:hypothetical protein